jgi:hypothetical protein
VTKLLRKCQFTEPSERQLLGNKMTKEIGQLENWFESMAPNVGDKVVNIFIINFYYKKSFNKLIS